ncbi:MAG: hypothetical protein CM1200mP28_01990 [Deltaproteobacteria bacterium]|nr:MAG: hypothetical protein CM1200mP28_01990 [Deltaproteobacteria bacterium]
MEKRVYFKGWFLPALLIAPQLAITAFSFFIQQEQQYGGRSSILIHLD